MGNTSDKQDNHSKQGHHQHHHQHQNFHSKHSRKISNHLDPALENFLKVIFMYSVI